MPDIRTLLQEAKALEEADAPGLSLSQSYDLALKALDVLPQFRRALEAGLTEIDRKIDYLKTRAASPEGHERAGLTIDALREVRAAITRAIEGE